MKICISSNCQGAGIATFLNLAPNAKKYQVREIPHLIQFYQGLNPKAHPEFPPAEQERIVREADIIFYHAKGGEEPDIIHQNEKVPKIPLSVVYNSAYFMQCWEDRKDFEPILERARTEGVHAAVCYAVDEHDFGYEARWQKNFEQMKKKENDEEVPEATRISPFFAASHREHRPLITYNHPTSFIFYEWTDLILRHLNEPPLNPALRTRAILEPNMAGLPCEFAVGNGARKYMDLDWGGTPPEQASCDSIARERINRWLNE